MTRNRSKARFWTVLGVINLLVLAYPLNLFLDSTSQDGTMMAVIVLCAALLLLAVGDMISFALAYSTSY